MSGVKRVQIFIHRFYDAIKLVLLFIIMLLVTLGILYQLEINARASADRGQAVIRVTESIKDETDKQTAIINKQFQALCFLLVEVAGEDALESLDPPIDEQCRTLADDLRKENAISPTTTQLPSQAQMTIPQTKDTTEKQSQGIQTTEDTSDESEQVGLVLGLSNVIQGTINGVQSLLGDVGKLLR